MDTRYVVATRFEGAKRREAALISAWVSAEDAGLDGCYIERAERETGLGQRSSQPQFTGEYGKVQRWR
ncbi:hypothetical protein Hypma_000342 [Hypsizygus marmoreus]|uniref:Uncharacterized protein n=1 Tax=Hypsizygus marmoreus TaxID=39966 RepID=A0A369JFF1_HYPMA|nr:hypothetical protein Hypma_000342 [Hypsizygus marmoreus]